LKYSVPSDFSLLSLTDNMLTNKKGQAAVQCQ